MIFLTLKSFAHIALEQVLMRSIIYFVWYANAGLNMVFFDQIRVKSTQKLKISKENWISKPLLLLPKSLFLQVQSMNHIIWVIFYAYHYTIEPYHKSFKGLFKLTWCKSHKILLHCLTFSNLSQKSGKWPIIHVRFISDKCLNEKVSYRGTNISCLLLSWAPSGQKIQQHKLEQWL